MSQVDRGDHSPGELYPEHINTDNRYCKARILSDFQSLTHPSQRKICRSLCKSLSVSFSLGCRGRWRGTWCLCMLMPTISLHLIQPGTDGQPSHTGPLSWKPGRQLSYYYRGIAQIGDMLHSTKGSEDHFAIERIKNWLMAELDN